jgi:LPS-assembly protein
VSRAYTEGFRSRTYAAANAYHFQGLRFTDDPGQTPIVAPLLDYNFMGEPGWYDGRFSLDGNLATITRTQGADMRRVSGKAGWQLPYTSEWGERYTFFVSAQADGYWSDDVSVANRASSDTVDGATGRFFPQTGVEWSLPLVRSGTVGSDLIEPVAGVLFGPNVGQNRKIPNEDSRDIELDDTNLFRPNRFAGIDRLEGGARFNYGLRTASYFPIGHMLAFVGQSYRPHRDSDFQQGSGLDDHFSDVVGRIELTPFEELRLLYRFRLDKEDLSPRRTEIGAVIGPQALNFKVDYLNLERLTGTNEFETDREEITVSVNSWLTDHWSVGARTRRDIALGEAIYHGLRAVYEDECFIFGVDYIRSFTTDRDVRPSDRFLFRFELKTIGSFETGT